MFTIAEKERFEEVGEEIEEGLVEYSYRGYNYSVSNGKELFKIRTYDDEPSVVTVVSPTDARVLPCARELVRFLVSSLGVKEIKFYSGSLGAFATVNLETLQFKHENKAT